MRGGGGESGGRSERNTNGIWRRGGGGNPGKMASRAAKLPLNVIQCGGIAVLEPPGGAGARCRALNYMNVRTPVCKGCPRGRKDTELENSSIKIFIRLQGFGLSILLPFSPFNLC